MEKSTPDLKTNIYCNTGEKRITELSNEELLDLFKVEKRYLD